MAQQLIQARSASLSGPYTLAFSSQVSKGDLLFAALSYVSTAGQPTLTDTQSNSWTEIGEVSSVDASQLNLICFWTIASATGSCTLTFNMGGVTGPSNVWGAIAEFSGASELAIISGSSLGFGVSPALGRYKATVQADTPPITTPTGSLLIAVAATLAATATWSVDPQNNWYTIATQANGIVLAYTPNLYANAPFCDLTPPKPILDRTGDGSAQWVMLTAPFTTTTTPPFIDGASSSPVLVPTQYPPYPHDSSPDA